MFSCLTFKNATDQDDLEFANNQTDILFACDINNIQPKATPFKYASQHCQKSFVNLAFAIDRIKSQYQLKKSLLNRLTKPHILLL